MCGVGEVENPRPGVPAVLEPLNITEAVASGSVATTVERQVPVRLCNFSTSKAALLKGVCLGLLVEAYPDEPKSLFIANVKFTHIVRTLYSMATPKNKRNSAPFSSMRLTDIWFSESRQRSELKIATYIACHTAIQSADHLGQLIGSACDKDFQMH